MRPLGIKSRSVVLATLLFALAAPASAIVISPSAAELQTVGNNITDTGGNTISTSATDEPLGVRIQATIDPNGPFTLDLTFDSGAGAVSIANSAGDVFQVGYFNSNASAWTYEVVIFAGVTEIGSDSTSVAGSTGDTLSIALDGQTITRIVVNVTGGPFGEPGGGFDESTDSVLFEVPGPAPIALLGLGLVGLGFRRRRLTV